MSAGAGERRRIAVVDDDASVRKAMSRLLASAGYSVELFDSAEAFIESHEVHHVDCLLLDIRMGGMSGVDLQTYLSYQGASMPVIFITGYADDPSRRQAELLGAEAYFHKPVDDKVLLGAIDRAVAK
jgi:FixJ family two-component response regulator